MPAWVLWMGENVKTKSKQLIVCTASAPAYFPLSMFTHINYGPNKHTTIRRRKKNTQLQWQTQFLFREEYGHNAWSRISIFDCGGVHTFSVCMDEGKFVPPLFSHNGCHGQHGHIWIHRNGHIHIARHPQIKQQLVFVSNARYNKFKLTFNGHKDIDISLLMFIVWLSVFSIFGIFGISVCVFVVWFNNARTFC